jgi:hypothetical protein
MRPKTGLDKENDRSRFSGRLGHSTLVQNGARRNFAFL